MVSTNTVSICLAGHPTTQTKAKGAGTDCLKPADSGRATRPSNYTMVLPCKIKFLNMCLSFICTAFLFRANHLYSLLSKAYLSNKGLKCDQTKQGTARAPLLPSPSLIQPLSYASSLPLHLAPLTPSTAFSIALSCSFARLSQPVSTTVCPAHSSHTSCPSTSNSASPSACTS